MSNQIDPQLLKTIANALWAFYTDGAFRARLMGQDMLAFELQRRAVSDTADYIGEHCPGIMTFGERFKMFEYVLPKTRDGLFLEFGVYKGASINFTAAFMERLGRPTRHYGFDAFEGIDEDMRGTDLPKGGLSLGGRIPEGLHPNVEIVKGWFDATLPGFVRERGRDIAFIHVDSDTYASTKIIFDTCGPLIGPGTIIIFDEYWSYPAWRQNEHKAWREFVDANGVTYRYLAHSGMQVAVEVLSR